MTPNARACPERLRRVCRLGDAVRSYAEMVGILYDLVGSGLHSEVQTLQRKCRQAWQTVEEERLALYRHEANHGCDRCDFAAHAGDG